ncbi:intraflagellar transport protein 172 homolog isoform X1 [Bacillus rossius redtenbacheri]|uniref:intraflagellar transport protein 172 homolog isoform X1 n=1 Tax=Bacillus rossius redtenbacheri TaxID=93214 RepID=UPI002FDDBC5C
MQLKYLKTVVPAEEAVARICALAWSPNNIKLAVCTADRVVSLFDENGEKRDKFSTKPIDSKYGKRSYIVKGLAFSPDSTKLAVGQTDNIIFVYRIGDEWGGKKVICNKFVQQSAVTCLVWLAEGPIVFGQTDGKVRVANIKNNKSQTLYATDSFVVALAANSKGTGFVSGHLDGSIVRYYVTDDGSGETQGRVATHPVPPYALAWPLGHVVAAGCDRRVSVYGKDGRVTRHFDYGKDAAEKEFTVACCSPSGQAVAVGSYDRVRVFSWSPRKAEWEESKSVEVRNLYSVTALGWKKDGSCVACGSLCGAVQLFESVLRRSVWHGKFEMTYVGPSQVLVKPTTPGARGVILKSQYGYEIEDVRIMGQDRYLVARTPETLLLGDLQRNLLSEVLWAGSGSHERFYFDNPSVCLVFNAGELSLVEYGDNHILGSVRTEFMNPHQISVRLNERRLNPNEENKKLAYLLDLKTICIVDLLEGVTIAQVSHDSKIDWLELNETGHKLLFRDKKMRLTLLDIRRAHKVPILSYCTFVQWVPGSDVVVTQSRNNLCVWYNIDAPDQVTIFAIKGDVVDVVRADGKTEVIVQEGQHQLGYELDESLLEFGTAVHDNDFGRAILFLENLGGKPEADGMWTNLANIAIMSNKLRVAERCFAALGNVARTHYLRETIHIGEQFSKEYGVSEDECPEVWARMAILNKRFKEAEAIYLEQNQLDEAISMYRSLHKWDEALALAEMKGHPRLGALREEYMGWLTDTRQGEKAGEIKERAGDREAALTLYLQAGLPSRAARLVQSDPEMLRNEELVGKVSSALERADMLEQLGELYEKVNRTEKAFACYRKAKAFSRAIELARFIAPEDVVSLEEEWGNHLMASKQMDAAVSHFIEAGRSSKALEAAMAARQWKKAVHIIQAIEDVQSVSKYYVQLGEHFASTHDYKMAEKLYLKAGMFEEVMAMYMQGGDWEKAYEIARQHLDLAKVSPMFIEEAKKLEEQGKLRDAEKLYLSVAEPDLAISMYKKHRQYDQMIRLVSQHHPGLVQTTHLHLAQELEAGSDWQRAEHHYLAAGEWKNAVNMYRAADLWEDAYRVARSSGEAQAALQVAFLWAVSLGPDSASKLLAKLHLLEEVVEYACEITEFDFAFELARLSLKQKLPDIHYKYAMTLEDHGKFKLAEEEFMEAGKPREAVLMYIHNQDWINARRVAELHDAESLPEVLVGQAKDAFDKKNFSQFESHLLLAKKPEIIVLQYQEVGMWAEAVRACQEYLPAQLPAVQARYEQAVGSSTAQDSAGYLAQARQWERSGDYREAIDCYLKVNPANTKDPNAVVQAWREAANLVGQHLQGPVAIQVAKVLGPQLIAVKEYILAAKVFMTADLVKEAIDAFIIAEEWSKAKRVARELEPEYEEYVDKHYKESLRRQGRADQLADVDIIGALDLLAEQRQWGRCLETATRHGPQVLNKYVALQASHLIKDGYVLEALDLYTKYDVPLAPQNFNIYKRIAVDVFGLKDLSGPESYQTWAKLRTMLFRITEGMQTVSDLARPLQQEFEELLLICHYFASRCAFRSAKALDQLTTKLSVAMLRHTDVIPADKAFYEAGTDCKAVERESEAFVFLNHYLDLSEAMEEGNLELVDHTDLGCTDFPAEIPLPAAPFLSPQQHEEVKEWVLAVSMDQRVDQVLPLDDRGVYAAKLGDAPACVVSGFPVLARRGRNPVELGRPGRLANRDDWNKLLMAAKMAPDSVVTDVLAFIEEWCGGAPGMLLH